MRQQHIATDASCSSLSIYHGRSHVDLIFLIVILFAILLWTSNVADSMCCPFTRLILFINKTAKLSKQLYAFWYSTWIYARRKLFGQQFIIYVAKAYIRRTHPFCISTHLIYRALAHQRCSHSEQFGSWHLWFPI